MRGLHRLGLSGRDHSTSAVDLGGHPPLLADGHEDEAPIHRGVHWRWLTGTVLTGFISIFLMGGALMAALNNPDQAPITRETLELPSDSATQNVEFGEKGDRLHPHDEEVASRQIVQVSTVTRQGERDYVKLRPFARITASLVIRKDLAANVPPYDAMRLFADTSPPDAPDAAAASTGVAAPKTEDQIYGANVDGEVSLKVTDFPLGDPTIDGGAGLDTPEVEQVVRAATNLGSATQVAAVAGAEAGPNAGKVRPDRAAGTSINIVPENVSNVAKSGVAQGPALDNTEKIFAVAKGETFRALLDDNKIPSADSDGIVAALADLIDLNSMHVGQKIRVAFAPGQTDPDVLHPIRVSVYDNGAHQATVARTDSNTFVRADEPNFVEDDFSDQPVDEAVADTSGMPKVYDALYETALEQQVPQPLIDQLIKIFAFDVDYQSRVAPGDQVQIFHSLADPKDPDAGEPEVLYASLTLGGVTRQFYRFRTGDDGIVDYYDDEGRSAKKFLVRKPVTNGIIRSGFGWRIHPILGYRRLHTGVDYAAPRGTPIFAAGNGVIEKAGVSSGYGNFTLIRHTNGYETGYGHQQQFAPGIVPGARVHQGQLIGYVGSTGLSTGPHVHFEIRVNGTPVDPLRIRLPRGRVLGGDEFAAFENERARIDALMGAPAVPSAKVAAATN